MPNIFAMGSGAFGQLLYTWDVYNVNTTTTYSIQRVLVLDSNGYYVAGETGLTDVFGFDEFYIGDGFYSGSLTNGVLVDDAGSIGNLYANAQSASKYYIQPKDDYEQDTGDNIFVIDYSSEMSSQDISVYVMTKGYADSNVPVLASATTAATVSATAATQTGWNSSNYYYYFDKTSETTQSKGTSTGNTVTSYNATAYPADGIQSGYWYTRR